MKIQTFPVWEKGVSAASKEEKEHNQILLREFERVTGKKTTCIKKTLVPFVSRFQLVRATLVPQWQDRDIQTRTHTLTERKQGKKALIETCVKHCPALKGGLKWLLCMSPLTTKVVYCLAKQYHHISLVMKRRPVFVVRTGRSHAAVLAIIASTEFSSLYVWLDAAFRDGNNGKCGDIFIVCT